MVDKPTLPRGLVAPTYEQAGVRDRAGRTITAINRATDFANESVLYRQSPATRIEKEFADNPLDARAPVIVDDEMMDVERPDIIDPFTDGGYHFVDDMEGYTGTEPPVASKVSSRYELANTRVPATAVPGVGTNGFRYIDMGGGYNNTDTGLIQPTNYLPVHPLALRSRFRGIVEYNVGQRPGIVFEQYDRNGTRRGQNRVQVRDAGVNGRFRNTNPDTSLVQFFGGLHFSRGTTKGSGRIDQDGGFPTSGVLVFEAFFEPYQFRIRPRLRQDAMSFSVGHYDTATAAFADTRPGGAFACLEPEHPNFMGTDFFTGGGQFRPDPIGHQRIGIGQGRWYYIEATIGDVRNDVFNRLRGVRISPEDADNLDTLEGS